MEKTWICCAGLFAGLTLMVTGLSAAEDVKKVKVEVEVPIEGGDEASALQEAQKRAFEKAYAKTLSTRLDPETRERMLRKAARYVKSFERLEKNQVGQNLQVTYVVDVMVESSSAPSVDPYKYAQYFEILWNGTRAKPSAAALTRHLQEGVSAQVETIRMSGETWWLAVSSRSSASAIRRSMQTFVSDRGQVQESTFETRTVEESPADEFMVDQP